ncbi:2-oxoglutarate dehydrogenase E1 component [Aureibacter tunicatorum]|uniref:oxoglutarate dehydrogenase (succinyl-transferring) n=1 Tax=Aureibacter tunicatorum TaxID=866807 RepID=A0AAE4BQY9_9BACT|nr:2-oxoglutarate dehydrogenase E1 component [Aureibacter tunicatorum]MDR6237388.1 2-oxoglutarate dehydrogenase E1 component [Aureibacter tunicatorum]BDD06378.1 2-oxoglutarate dehydrogenase subunit E1 [Aureibacter tunicatorum]
MDKYSYIANAHGEYIDQLYESYKNDPASVDESWQKFFEGFEFAELQNAPLLPGDKTTKTSASTSQPALGADASSKEILVRNLIHAYRTRGHLRAKTNPVRERRQHNAYLDPHTLGLSDSDLEKTFEIGNEIGIGKATLQKILDRLKSVYEGHIGFEYMHIREAEIIDWFKNKVEREMQDIPLSLQTKKRILSKLNEAVVFENFLHTKYIGQKRFSLEGGETTIPALDSMINKGADLGIEEVIIGMAHRGRLNVLANTMGKTYEQIFNEFEGQCPPDSTMGGGDVKYHLGFKSKITTPAGKNVSLNLAPNPSHLEAVDPVVIGSTRAKLDYLYNKDKSKIVPILIHGDAALAGQGVVYEVAQMAGLHGYNIGGTIHFVINNQLGFTTDYDDARTSIYSTDVAKVTDSPVLHVNGDDPEAVVRCMELAIEFRQKFQRDIYIDMVCYRRHGHNESDEPKFTQPSLYKKISKHANPREVYNQALIERGDIDAHLAKEMDQQFKQLLQDRLDQVKQNPLPYTLQPFEAQWNTLRLSTKKDFESSPDTSISEDNYNKVAGALTNVPENFKPLRQIDKLLKERQKMFFDNKELNWASAELLAYGSILLDGKKVRISGQDVRRGTFSHRHAVLFDSETNQPYSSLDNMDPTAPKFSIYNSLLSEYAVLGFEVGYSMANPNALTIWEGQFGDFANGAQVMIDQFIASMETKWNKMNGIVMLLPHGYEGQGPEHSSARLERYLQLCAEDNMIITNITSPANFFHALRRQLAWPFRKPLINMSPKSLLRHPKCVSPSDEFLNGHFQEVIDDANVEAGKVKRILFCTGKLYYELLERQQSEKREDVAVVRLEQLHPLPLNQIEAILAKYEGAEVVWVQEEPKNQGAWWYINNHTENIQLSCISREPSATPATGFAKIHAKEQADIIDRSFA